MKTYKKLIAGFIILAMVMTAIGASGLVSNGNANQNAINPETTENNALAVTSVSWYSQNSSELPAPGSSGIPLYVTFIAYTTINDINISINLTAYKAPLSYAYISGPDKNVRTFNVMPEVVAGHSYTIMQLVNINKSSESSFYDENLSYYNSTISGNTTITIPVGKPQIGIISYSTNPPVIYQNEKFIKLTVYTENTGTSSMKNVNVYITSPNYTIVSPSNYNISYYPLGKLLNFTFYIDAKNVTGNSPLEFHINQNVYTLNTYIHGNGKTSLSVAIENTRLISNTKKQLMVFYLNNTGTKSFIDIEIHMLSPEVISIYVSSSNPLGALTANNVTFAQIRPGESIKVTYLVDTSPGSAGTYPVQLLVQYHFNNTAETFNKVFTYNQTIQPTTEKQISSTLTEPLYAGMAALIIVILGAIVAVSVHNRRRTGKAKKGNGNKKDNNGTEKKP
ncbi:hypothetical protein [Ferroplasma sp.]|uniref:hypothetical protein n=1 Tax=Ferroplasma sp. TaxID=2591003 RepID=UPI00307F32F8